MGGVLWRERWKERKEKGHLCSILSRSSFFRPSSPSFLPQNKFTASWSAGQEPSFSVGISEWEEVSLSLCAAYILLFSHGAVTGRPIHHGTWSWTGTLWNSVNIRQVDAQMPDSLKTCESLFVFIFKVTGGKVHHQGFIQSKDWLLLTFIHFLSTAFLSVFIKGLSLHSESFSSL